MRRLVVTIGFACSIASGAFSQTRDKCPSTTSDGYFQVIDPNLDTVRVTLVCYTTSNRGILFTKTGYCVQKYKLCTKKHLDDLRRPIKLPLHIAFCTEPNIEDKNGVFIRNLSIDPDYSIVDYWAYRDLKDTARSIFHVSTTGKSSTITAIPVGLFKNVDTIRIFGKTYISR